MAAQSIKLALRPPSVGQVIETMLHSFVGDFFTGKAELDEILRQANECANRESDSGIQFATT
jgi:hypothetical protein